MTNDYEFVDSPLYRGVLNADFKGYEPPFSRLKPSSVGTLKKVTHTKWGDTLTYYNRKEDKICALVLSNRLVADYSDEDIKKLSEEYGIPRSELSDIADIEIEVAKFRRKKSVVENDDWYIY